MSQPMNPDFESKHERGPGGKFARMDREENQIEGLGNSKYNPAPVDRYAAAVTARAVHDPEGVAAAYGLDTLHVYHHPEEVDRAAREEYRSHGDKPLKFQSNLDAEERDSKNPRRSDLPMAHFTMMPQTNATEDEYEIGSDAYTVHATWATGDPDAPYITAERSYHINAFAPTDAHGFGAQLTQDEVDDMNETHAQWQSRYDEACVAADRAEGRDGDGPMRQKARDLAKRQPPLPNYSINCKTEWMTHKTLSDYPSDFAMTSSTEYDTDNGLAYTEKQYETLEEAQIAAGQAAVNEKFTDMYPENLEF